MNRCAITGSTGYLGNRLASYFRSRHWDVLELKRTPSARGHISYHLDADMPMDVLDGISTLVHCAYDFQARTPAAIHEINVKGSVRLLKAACKKGIQNVIFISSMAAYEDCKSHYGAGKLAVERELAGLDILIVRPGVIYGKNAGGLLASVRRVVSRLPVVPLIGDGRYPLFTAHEDDLSELLFDLATDHTRPQRREPIIAAALQPLEFRQLVKDLASAVGRSPVLLPVPWRLPYYALRLLEAMGFAPGLRSDSVISLVEAKPKPEPGVDTAMQKRFRPFSARDL